MAEDNESIVKTFEGGWGLFSVDTQGSVDTPAEGDAGDESHDQAHMCSFCKVIAPGCVELSDTLCEEGEARFGEPVTYACKADFKKYFSSYSFFHGKACSNPYGDHQTKVKTRLTIVTLEMFRQDKSMIPGRKVCQKCFQKYEENLLRVEANDLMEVQEDVPEASQHSLASQHSVASSAHAWSQENALENIDSALGLFQESPLKKNKVDNHDYVNQKIAALNKKMRDTLHVGSPEEERDAKGFTEALKERFERGDRDEKYRSLTSCPESWKTRKLMTTFNCSFNLASNALKLRELNGPGCCPGKKFGRMLPDETKQKVQEFYLDQGVSRHLPGQKDVVMVRGPNGQKEERRKHLLLSNLNEAYCLFKQRNPDVSVAFSTFANLRPQQVVLAGLQFFEQITDVFIKYFQDKVEHIQSAFVQGVFFTGPPQKNIKSKIVLEYPDWASPGPPKIVKVYGLGLP